MSQSQTDIDICNQALSWLGANSIIAFDQDSTEARLCSANYEPLRDAVIEDHEWSFAKKRQRLGSPLSDPNGDYAPYKAFKLADEDGVLRVLHVNQDPEFNDTDQLFWEYENNLIICQIDVVYVRYLRRVVDPSKFSPNFAQALATRMAAELCLSITESDRMAQAFWAQYQLKLANALNTDGLQGSNRRLRSTWMRNSRWGSGSRSA